MTSRKCFFCTGEMPKDPNFLICPHCKCINVKGAGPSDTPKLKRLSDASSKPVPRYDVGIFNRLFGKGLAVTSVNIIGGEPGCGKTTLFLMLFDMVLSQVEGDALYICNEQSDEEVKDYAERLGILHIPRIWFLDARDGDPDIAGAILDKKPKIAALDSISRYVNNDPSQGARVTERLKDYTIQMRAPFLIINQVNAQGEHLGHTDQLHAGDSIMTMEKDDTTGQRMIASSKNRMGMAPIVVPLMMQPDTGKRPGYLDLDDEALEQLHLDREYMTEFDNRCKLS